MRTWVIVVVIVVVIVLIYMSTKDRKDKILSNELNAVKKVDDKKIYVERGDAGDYVKKFQGIINKIEGSQVVEENGIYGDETYSYYEKYFKGIPPREMKRGVLFKTAIEKMEREV